MTRRPSASLFIAIGLVLYGALAAGCEWLVYRNGHSNALYKVATAPAQAYDWVILGASHAMPLDFGDANAAMQSATGMRIINLASAGTGPLYNRFVLDAFLAKHDARHVLYVIDSFAFRSRAWNEDRFSDAKMIRGTPLKQKTAALWLRYVRDDQVPPASLLDYLTSFSKVNNRDRFQRDAWEGEAQFNQVYRPSAAAVRKRIAYLYPDPPRPDALARYLDEFAALVDVARRHGARVVALRLPALAAFRQQLPDEAAFNQALATVLTQTYVALIDLSTALDEPRFYFDTDHLNRAGVTELFNRHLKALLMGGGPGPRGTAVGLLHEASP